MWSFLLLAACAGSPTDTPEPRPEGVPDDAVEVHVGPKHLRVGAEEIGTTKALLANPVDGLHPPLIAALDGVDSAFLRVREGTPWVVVRKLVNSADSAGVEDMYLGTDERAWAPPRPVRSRWNPACPSGPAEVVGVQRAWTLEIHAGPDGTWVLGKARFQPRIRRDGEVVAMDDLPPSCWTDASCDLLSGPAREACEGAPERAPRRVDVAGRWGCLLPLAKEPDQVDAWPEALSKLVDAYGIGPEDDVMLIPEAKVPFSAVGAVLDAFEARGQAPPTLGQPLVEGNDGPPLCTTVIRDRPALDRAMGAWLGASLP